LTFDIAKLPQQYIAIMRQALDARKHVPNHDYLLISF
jgi:hypothetical protein